MVTQVARPQKYLDPISRAAGSQYFLANLAELEARVQHSFLQA